MKEFLDQDFMDDLFNIFECYYQDCDKNPKTEKKLSKMYKKIKKLNQDYFELCNTIEKE